jgi:hypothetical protein
MPIGAAVSQISLQGNFVDYTGAPISGQVKFTLSDLLQNGTDNQMIVPSTKSVTLDANGSFTTTLPATNDPDLVPIPYTITVEEAFPKGRTYTISLPYTTVGSLNLADISPAVTAPDTYVGLVSDSLWNTLTANIDVLDAQIDQGASSYVFSGKYRYFELGNATYTALNARAATYTLLTNITWTTPPSYFTTYQTQTENASTSSSASLATAQSLTTGVLNSFLFIGG